MTSDYVRHLRSLVPLDCIRPLRVVADAGNGMAGYMVPKVFDGHADVAGFIAARIRERYPERTLQTTSGAGGEPL